MVYKQLLAFWSWFVFEGEVDYFIENREWEIEIDVEFEYIQVAMKVDREWCWNVLIWNGSK